VQKGDTMAEKETGTSMVSRIYWLDNLRTFMIFLVILLHAALIYEKTGLGTLWWIVVDPSNSDLPSILFIILNIFVIATIFFISGFFTPLSLKNKTACTFLKSKFKRLMVPWIMAVLTLIPLYKIIFLNSRNLPREGWTTYFHFNSIWSQNWLWFLPVLFLFDVLYLCLSKLHVSMPRVTFRKAVWAVFVVCFLYSFLMDYFNLHGWTKTVLIDFQNERIFIYFMVFLLGALCCKLKLFESEWKNKKLDIILHSTGWLPINLYIFLLIYSLVKPGDYLISHIVDTLILRLNFMLSLAYLLYVMITTFRKYLNKQGRIMVELNKNSYGVYIIHVIVMGGIASAMLNAAIPSLLKFLLLTVSTFAVSNLIISCYRKAITSKILNNRMEESVMKKIITATLLIILLSMAGCRKQDNSDNEKKPPRVSLHVAALQGNLDTVKQHINYGSDLNEKDAYGSSPLIIAATFGKTEVARALVDAGADIQITNNEGSTPLHIAAFLCRTEIVKALLDKGADKNALNKAGRTALESVAGPFDDVKGIYDSIAKGLKPLGFKLDYERIKRTRPRIAEMMK
jgi:peptidoglycan/LPS O-acetylase OafA/YrhL